MKKRFLCFVILFFIAKVNAQQSAMQFANAELRKLFSNVSNPNPQVKFFYDLSGHFVDSAFFYHYVTDTSNAENWYAIYQEMYYMAYDTNAYVKPNLVYNMVLPTMQSDTIPVGLIDWDFNLLKPDALSTGNYFNFDTVNTLLYDLLGVPSPYTTQTTFAGSTLRDEYPFTNPVFQINPQWIFKDSAKVYLQKGTQFKIDFGDGTGWHLFTDNLTQYYQAVYSSGGIKTVQYGVFINNVLTRYSLSKFKITTNNPKIPPTSVVFLPGMVVSFYEPTGCNVNTEKKYVIYLEGFDALNHRHGPQIYNEMIVTDSMAQLKNFGYTFVIVDWYDGNAPLISNAMNVVNLLDYLKCGNHVPLPQPFVMVGESMGGLIARYALCYMESPSYNGCVLPVAHNTRLLLTFDTPHQGANIPLGLQYLYKYGTTSVLAILGISPFIIGSFSSFQNALDGAANEMLKYHINTDPFLNSPISTATITQHPNKTNFDAQLANLGNYPRYCKTVALSNGSWLGVHQPNTWNGTPRQPNDKMLDIHSDVYLKVLGIKILGTVFDLDLKTNPSNNGQVFFAGIGVSHWKIKLKWFGANLIWWTDYLLKLDKNVQNVKPYCVMPASNNNIPNLGDIFGFQISNANGNVNFQGSLGISYFGSANLDFNAYSDGFNFGFVPTASSFDYDMQGRPLDDNILNDPIATTLSRTPFDAVITNATTFNRNHLYEENPSLQRCATCTNFSYPLTSFLLNREIGDDSLWLENFYARYQTRIEAERDILVNHRNIYYNYTNPLSPIHEFNINFYTSFSTPAGAVVLSKQKPMNFIYGQQLMSNNQLWVNGAQPPIGPYSWYVGGMTICCINYYYKMLQPQDEKIKPEITGSLAVYPNPAKDQLTIKYQMTTKEKVQIIVYDIMGRKLDSYQPPFEDNTQECYYPIPVTGNNWTSGTYIIEVANSKESHQATLIITK